MIIQYGVVYSQENAEYIAKCSYDLTPCEGGYALVGPCKGYPDEVGSLDAPLRVGETIPVHVNDGRPVTDVLRPGLTVDGLIAELQAISAQGHGALIVEYYGRDHPEQVERLEVESAYDSRDDGRMVVMLS